MKINNRKNNNLINKNNKKIKQIIAKKSHFRQEEITEILQKVKCNQPQTYSQIIHIKILEKFGINFNQPIFIEYANKLNFSYAKSLYLASKIQPFLLVIFYTNEATTEYKKLLCNAHFYNARNIDLELKKQLMLANINYEIKHFFPKNLTIKSEEKINLICEKIVKKYNNYCYETSYNFADFNFKIIKTYYNGKYIFINEKLPKNINLKIINELKTNFFDYFQAINNKNVRSMRGKNYYFYSSKKAQKIEIIRAQNKDYLICEYKTSGDFWFYFGQESTCEINPNINQICEKISELFSIKLICGDGQIEHYFNTYLPNQIIREKILQLAPASNNLVRHNLTFRQVIMLHKQKKISALTAYETLQRLAFFKTGNMLIVNKTEFKNIKFELFLAGKKRAITVTQTNKKLLRIGNVTYAGSNSIALENLEKYDNFEFEI